MNTPTKLFALLTFTAALCAAALDLKIEPAPNGEMKFEWASSTGVEYELRTTTSLDTFAVWTSAASPLVATGATSSVSISIPTNGNGFYRVLRTDATLPIAVITSHTNNQAVTGEIEISVFAFDEDRITSAELILDDEVIESMTDGVLRFRLNTTLYSNGPHTVQVRVQDNAGIGYLGGDPFSEISANEGFTETLTLDFSNSLRWQYAEQLFETFVPIEAITDDFPADWTVIIRDLSNTVVRSFSGSTTTSNIVTEWDGNDENENPAPSDNTYEIQLIVESSQAAAAMASGPNDSKSYSSSSVNKYGVLEYESVRKVQSEGHWQQVDLGITVWNPKTKSYDVIEPPKYIWKEAQTFWVTNRISEPELRTALDGEQTSIAMAAAAGPAIINNFVWRETSWTSGKALVSRQQYSFDSSRHTLNTSVLNMLTSVRQWITFASLDLGSDRDLVPANTVQISTDSDWSVLTNALVAEPITHFYYCGHGSGDAIGYSELTPNTGLTSTNFGQLFGNRYFPPTPGRRGRFEFKRPFRFVFMDGCNTARGGFPNAFGIPRGINASAYWNYGNKERRSYMGWNSLTKDRVALSSNIEWTLEFFEAFVGDSYFTTLSDAIDAATTAVPAGIEPGLIVVGSNLITWGQ